MRLERAAAYWGLGLLAWANTASAQDAAAAGALFDKGVADMQAGHYDTACPAVEESQRLDPHPGTLFTLAECQAKWGKVASAVTHYQDYVGVVSRLSGDQKARHRERVAIANVQLAKLKPTVPTLALVMPASAPKGTTVSRDGAELQGAALGLALAVDPGAHSIVTRVPGGQEHTMSVMVAPGEAKRVALEIDAPAALPATIAAVPVANGAPKRQQPAGATSVNVDAGKPSNTAAYVVGGIGVAGIVVGSVTGVMVFSKKSTVKDNCSGTDCSATGVDAAKAGKNLALVSNIGFGVGIAGLATATILLLAHGKSEAAAHVHGWEPLIASTPGGAWAGVGRHW